MHLGNLVGAVLPFSEHIQWNDAAIFIADLHALTSVKDSQKMREQAHEIAVEYFSVFGIDTPCTIFRQSDIRELSKLMWVLTNVTPYSLMLRAHSFRELQQDLDERYEQIYSNKSKKEILWELEDIKKDLKIIQNSFHDFSRQKSVSNSDKLMDEMNQAWEKISKALGTHVEFFDQEVMRLEAEIEKLKAEYYGNLNMGVFNYPILMAADIIGYDIDFVPVGRDQIQHIEMARDIARSFNKSYWVEVFKEPQAVVKDSVATLPGVDGRKMSKRYDNFIGVFDDDVLLKKRVMSIVSGSEWVDEKKKNPEECHIFHLYRIFATAEQTAVLRMKYESKNIGFGYGHAKMALFEVLSEYLRPYREARKKLLENPEIIEHKLAEGARMMNARIETKMQRVKNAVGVN